MTKSELGQKTYKQLLYFAAQAGISGRHRMKKAQLVKTLLGRHRRSAAPAFTATVRTPYQELKELPVSYGRSRLLLMEINPYQVHAFWEVTPEDREAVIARADSGSDSAAWVLRFRETAGTGSQDMVPCFDIPVDLEAGNWYAKMPANNRSFHAELGCLTAESHFQPLCLSNTVHIPRAEPSSVYQPEWLEVKDDLKSIVRVTEPKPSPQPDNPPSIQITIKVIQAIPSHKNPLGEPQLAIAPPHDEFEPIEKSLPPESDYTAIPGDGMEPNWTPHPEFSIYGISSYESVGDWQSTQELANAYSSGLPAEAEVQIDGCMQPGQELWVNGIRMRVNPDGTFHARWPLPTRSE